MSLHAPSHGPGRVRRTTAYAVVAGLLALCTAPAHPAAASGPGGATSDPPALAPPTGGGRDDRGPRVTLIRCRAHCTGPTAATSGSRLDVRGRAIARAESVIFLGADGEADDVTVRPTRVTRKRIVVEVPAFARSGPIAVATAEGAESAPSREALSVSSPPADGPPGLDVEVQSPKAFFDGSRKAGVTFVLRGPEPKEVDVVLRRAGTDAPLVRWTPGVVAPGVPTTVAWDGAAGGRAQPPGRYHFAVAVRSAPGDAAAAAAPAPDSAPEPEEFELLDHVFPIRGPHRYGTDAAQFGGGRGHQGHDVFAACGTPLVAARGGRVKFKQFHSRAGNYLVIDGEKTERDYAYMHLRDPALVDEGDRVRTGQPIGFVGRSGRASGCHLHFELWSAPGWYDGGKPYDPLASLRAWDEAS